MASTTPPAKPFAKRIKPIRNAEKRFFDRAMTVAEIVQKTQTLIGLDSIDVAPQIYIEAFGILERKPGGTKEAFRMYPALLRLEPTDVVSWKHYYELSMQIDPAQSPDIAKRGFRSCRASFFLGECMKFEAMNGNMDEAEKLSLQKKGDFDVQLKLAEIHWHFGDLNCARKILTSLTDTPKSAEAHALLFVLERYCGNDLAAFDVARQMIAGVHVKPSAAKMILDLYAKLAIKPVEIANFFEFLFSQALTHEMSAFYQLQGCYEASLGNVSNAKSLMLKAAEYGLNKQQGMAHIRVAFLEKSMESLNDAAKYFTKKDKYFVAVYQASLLEQLGNFEGARKCYHEAIGEHWRVHFEAAKFELRQKDVKRAIEIAKAGVAAFPLVGRMSEFFIELHRGTFPDHQLETFYKESLKDMPKSGDLMLSLGMMYMNPLSPCFNLDKAEEAIRKALQLTPQNGDTIIEWIRLLLLRNGANCSLAEVEKWGRRYHDSISYGIQWMAFAKSPHTMMYKEIVQNVTAVIKARLAKYDALYKGNKTADDQSKYLELVSATGIYVLSPDGHVLDNSFSDIEKLI